MLSNDLVNKYGIKRCKYSSDFLSKFIDNHKSDEPFYIVDLAEIVRTFELWNKLLPNVKPYYAMKCNPNPVILDLLSRLGCNFDCASKHELNQILKLTGDPSRIIFAHPCKYTSHIEYAHKHNIDLMTFDDAGELDKIKQFHPDAKLLLRLAVDDSQSLCKFNKKFGCKIENLHMILEKVQLLNLNLTGFSFHVGSGCNSAETYYEALKVCKYAQKIASTYGFVIDTIDIGGGFTHKSFEAIATQIKEAQTTFFEYDNIKFIAEPGRFMVETSHTLVLNVIGKKKAHDRFIYYLNDGVYGSFNCIIFDHQDPILIPYKNTNSTLCKSQLFGNTCDSLDEIQECIYLPELNVGDYIYVMNFGAYTTSAKSDHFNGYIVDDFIYIYLE